MTATLMENNFTPAASGTLKQGFMTVSTDSTGTTTSTIGKAGRIFGRLGQGDETMPLTSTDLSFRWEQEGVGGSHGTYISIFPAAVGDAGLSAGQKIVISTKAIKFAELEDFSPPTRPAAVEQIDLKSLSAYMMVASSMSIVLPYISSIIF